MFKSEVLEFLYALMSNLNSVTEDNQKFGLKVSDAVLNYTHLLMDAIKADIIQNEFGGLVPIIAKSVYEDKWMKVKGFEFNSSTNKLTLALLPKHANIQDVYLVALDKIEAYLNIDDLNQIEELHPYVSS